MLLTALKMIIVFKNLYEINFTFIILAVTYKCGDSTTNASSYQCVGLISTGIMTYCIACKGNSICYQCNSSKYLLSNNSGCTTNCTANDPGLILLFFLKNKMIIKFSNYIHF